MKWMVKTNLRSFNMYWQGVGKKIRKKKKKKKKKEKNFETSNRRINCNLKKRINCKT
jgi:hypothetical protein